MYVCLVYLGVGGQSSHMIMIELYTHIHDCRNNNKNKSQLIENLLISDSKHKHTLADDGVFELWTGRYSKSVFALAARNDTCAYVIVCVCVKVFIVVVFIVLLL